MDVYEFDEERTKESTNSSTIVGVIVLGALLVAILSANPTSSKPPSGPDKEQTECACPQVYVAQQGVYEFQNGIFSGAVYANLERMDYLPLPQVQLENGPLQMRITGQKNETQYINSLQLLGVQTPEGSKVLADCHGHFYTLANPQAPLSAFAEDQQDLSGLLSLADDDAYPFDAVAERQDFSHAYLTFDNPTASSKARLLIRAKNSHWAALLDKEYTLLFGEQYIPYRDQNENNPPENMEDFMLEQGLPIKVYIEQAGKWEFVDYFPLVGTENFREMVMEIDLPENAGKEVRLKLETTYRFWDLDYVAIDYTQEQTLKPIPFDAYMVNHVSQGEQREQVAKKDQLYTLLKDTESLDLTFKVADMDDPEQVSYFLAASGYYHIEKPYPVQADIPRLRKFNKAAEFDRFSRQKYRETEEMIARLAPTNPVSL